MKAALNSLIVSLLIVLVSCQETRPPAASLPEETATNVEGGTSAMLIELTDEQYPDNPDIEIRSSRAMDYRHGDIQFVQKADGMWDVVITGEKDANDQVVIPGIDLMEWIPTIPEHVKGDEYLELITVVNQEWNRQQVKLMPGQFQTTGAATAYTRVDLARNCLNARLWEVLTYEEEDGVQKPAYHGWFDFPDSLYRALFNVRNDRPFEKYASFLSDWKDPDSKPVDLSRLRKANEAVSLNFEVLDEQAYELIGERKKKFKNIVTPGGNTVPAAFQNDEARFATFSPPGCYTRAEPRVTELSRFDKLEAVDLREVQATAGEQKQLLELELTFRAPDESVMRMVLALDSSLVPVLRVGHQHKGFQMPMGIATHSFYEPYERAIENSALENPYYGLLLDEQGRWMDSHKIGIDGPLFHFDHEDPSVLHLWILSFERHAFTGHYAIQMP